MTDRTVRRLNYTLKVLNNIRPYQAVPYCGLAAWSVLSIVSNPTSPIVRFMPTGIHFAYVGLQLAAPLLSFVGQWVQWQGHLRADTRRQESGWWLQWAADAAIWWTLLVAVTAFIQATDEPSALFTVGWLAVFMLTVLLLTIRDGVAIVRCRCMRRREA